MAKAHSNRHIHGLVRARRLAPIFFLAFGIGTAGCSSEESDPKLAQIAEKTSVFYGRDTCRDDNECPMTGAVLTGGDVELVAFAPKEAGSDLQFDDRQVEVVVPALAEDVCYYGVGPRASDKAPVPQFARTSTGGCNEADATHRMLSAVVRPKVAGVIGIDVVDEGRRLIKTVTFEAREAADLLVSVQHTSPAQPDGSYSLRVGSSLGFRVTPKDAGGLPLIRRGSSGVTFSWDDPSIVEPDESGATGDDHVVIARKPGAAQLTIEAGAAKKTFVVNTFDF